MVVYADKATGFNRKVYCPISYQKWKHYVIFLPNIPNKCGMPHTDFGVDTVVYRRQCKRGTLYIELISLFSLNVHDIL